MTTQTQSKSAFVTLNGKKVNPINGGRIGNNEQLFSIDVSKFKARNGTPIRMMTSTDKGWVWLRFEVPLNATDEASIMVRGWNYSKTKRLGYWITASTEEQAKFIRQLGCQSFKHFDYVPEVPLAASDTMADHAEMVIEAPKPNGKTTNGVHLNSKGRWVDGKGRYIKVTTNGKVTTVQPTINHDVTISQVKSNGTVAVVDESGVVGSSGASVEYNTGYEDGMTDGADETIPNIRTRLDMAKFVGCTVAELVAARGDDWFAGWFDGFEKARPTVRVRGLRGLMVK